jgi:hypothetical protein
MLVTFFVSANPVQLVLVYGVLGALFMPFLAATLLWLLNWRVDRQHRNGWASNAMLIVSLLLFGALCVADLLHIGK